MTTAVARPPLRRGLVYDTAAVLSATRRKKAVVAVVALVAALVIVLLFVITRPPGSRNLAFYSTGRATLTINGGSTNVLPLLAAGSTLVSPGGAGLTWQSPDGWYLNLNGPFSFAGTTPKQAVVPQGSAAPGPVPLDANGSFQLNGADFGRWAGIDSSACAIVYTEVGLTRIAGSISCRGLVWYDKASVEHVQPVDVPPFDLDVGFEATGDGKPPAANPS
jgi:hypothetical protein